MKAPAVYMMASDRNGTLYIGVTSDLLKRVWQHREGIAEGFTKEHDVKLLVWYEQHETMESAISREKAMKKWLRKWKLSTIEKMNPNWADLWSEIIGGERISVVATRASSVIPTSSDSPAASIIPGNAADLGSAVIPANAGIQHGATLLDSRIRGNDGTGEAV